jgi:peptide/nickel transport system permease protein
MGKVLRLIFGRPFFRVTAPAAYLVLLALFAIAGPLFVQDPWEMSSQDRFLGPSLLHFLGTDEFGRDIFSRLVHGARLSLGIGLGSVAIATVIGTAAGLIAGYFGGWREVLVMRSVELILSYPPVLLAILIVSFAGGNVWTVTVVIGALFVPRFARLVHSQTLVLTNMEFVEADRAVGRRSWSILWAAILPNMLGLISVHVALALGQAILTETGLSYLGLGPPASIPSWGRSIQTGAAYVHQSTLLVLWPALAISLTLISLNLIGDALSERFDPRARLVDLETTA